MTPNRKLRSLRASTASCNPWTLSRIPPLDPTISGVVVKEDEQNPKIYINSNEPEVRQRFTLAHEIGHLVEREHLGKDVEYSFIDYRNNGKCELHEFYADEFAGSLLMPAREFSKILDKKANLLPQSTSESHNQQ
ncbi:ImmA/IrrE family metallo-endopeptidase [Corynebacterium diphtheriae]